MTKRCFVSIDLPPYARDYVASLARRDIYWIKWVKPENFHITLSFLGDLTPERIADTRALLSDISQFYKPFTLKLTELKTNQDMLWLLPEFDRTLDDLADELKAKRLITSYERTATYQADGELLTDAAAAELEKIREQVEAALQQAQQQDDDVSVRQAVAHLVEQSDDGEQAQQLIDFVLSSQLEQEYSGSASHLSTLWHDAAKEFDGDDAFFVEGFHLITKYLAQNLNIELEQVVTNIQWGAAEVQVVTAAKTYVADHVIVTVPLGVLKQKRLQFKPELPQIKLDAISKLGMGVLNKCYLRFAKAFWPNDVDWLEYMSEAHGEWTEWVSLQRSTKIPVLLGFNAAERGRNIENLTDQQLVDDAMDTLRTMFGEDIPKPIDYQITRWAADPFSFGSYSFNAVGSNPQMREDLAAPLHKQLFFAGEATEQHYFGTAHGAYLSGLKAAASLIAS